MLGFHLQWKFTGLSCDKPSFNKQNLINLIEDISLCYKLKNLKKSGMAPSNKTKFYSSMATCCNLKGPSSGEHHKNFLKMYTK
jgi:hypothetical protein